MLDEIGYNISIYEPFVCILDKNKNTDWINSEYYIK